MKSMRECTKRLRWMVAGFVLLATGGMPLACAAGPQAHDGAPWEDSIRAMDEALARDEVGVALKARYAAHLAALGSRSWEGMAAVGDASLRLAQVPGYRPAMEREARRAYLSGLLRARHQRSLDGVLRMTEAFAALGDRDVARQGFVIASALAAASPEPYARERVRALQERLAAEVPLVGGGRSIPLAPSADAVVTP